MCDNYGRMQQATYNMCDCDGRIRNIGGVLTCVALETAVQYSYEDVGSSSNSYIDDGWYGNTSSG
jgi:hypothetical protein